MKQEEERIKQMQANIASPTSNNNNKNNNNNNDNQNKDDDSNNDKNILDSMEDLDLSEFVDQVGKSLTNVLVQSTDALEQVVEKGRWYMKMDKSNSDKFIAK